MSTKSLSSPHVGNGGLMPPGTTMGRPKKGKKKVPGSRTVGVRATAEWADWLERLAKHNRTDIAKVLDAAATHYAKATGFNEPPPERVP
jgi:hypothetical protein